MVGSLLATTGREEKEHAMGRVHSPPVHYMHLKGRQPMRNATDQQ